MNYGARIERLRSELDSRGIAGAVVSGASVGYLTGCLSGGGYPTLAVVGPNAAVLVAPSGSGHDAAVSLIGYAIPGGTLDRIADPWRGSSTALESALREAGLSGRTIGIEPGLVTARHAAVVRAAGTEADLQGCLERLRRVKDPDEVAAIREAMRVNEAGLAAAREAIRAGVSELEIEEAVVHALQVAGGVPVDVTGPTNGFVSGPRAEGAVGAPTPRRLERGDLMIIDINPVIRGYKGDLTRTFCVGEPRPDQVRAHDALVAGLEAVEGTARPGMAGSELYRTLLGPISAAGLGSDLPHHGGHAIGLEHLERPYVIPGEEEAFEEGAVFALEPGAYGPELGGMRIEDNYLITNSGVERLSHFARSLIVC